MFWYTSFALDMIYIKHVFFVQSKVDNVECWLFVSFNLWSVLHFFGSLEYYHLCIIQKQMVAHFGEKKRWQYLAIDGITMLLPQPCPL